MGTLPIFSSRPLAEATEETLIRRKTAARNYENVVKKDAKFFQCIGRFGEHREKQGRRRTRSAANVVDKVVVKKYRKRWGLINLRKKGKNIKFKF